MKEYQKPFIEEEQVELEDIIAVSGGSRSVGIDDTDDGIVEDPIDKIW